MISTMTVEQLLERYLDYRRKATGEEVAPERLRPTINDLVEPTDFEELSSSPRIILRSENFPQGITTTVLQLRDFGLDISCARLTHHRSDNKTISVPEKIIPLHESEEYITCVQQKEEFRQKSKGRSCCRTKGTSSQGRPQRNWRRLPSDLTSSQETSRTGLEHYGT